VNLSFKATMYYERLTHMKLKKRSKEV